jgi:hypothetical protein
MRMLGRVGAVDAAGEPTAVAAIGDWLDDSEPADDDAPAAANQASVDTNGVPCVGNVQCDVSFDRDPLPDDADGNRFSWERRLKGKRYGVWEAYQGLLGVVGLAALPQVGLVRGLFKSTHSVDPQRFLKAPPGLVTQPLSRL